MSATWENVGFIKGSTYRRLVLRRLELGEAIPSEIAEDAGLDIAQVSRSLSECRDRDLVEFLVPESRNKGRVYGLTDDGAEVLGKMDGMEVDR